MNSLNNAFKDLRKAGYFARQNFTCCQSCGWSEIPNGKEKVVFYHSQDNDDKIKGNDFHLAWSGDGKEICEILNRNGVLTEWNENENTRIKIINYQ
jgi:hypothetical protein